MDNNNPTTQDQFNWDKFSLNGQSSSMKQQMLDDVFVLERTALLGQHTIYYAAPNAGKTLITLYQITVSINNGNFKAENLMYVNADDTFKGLTTKLGIAEKFGFQMVAPGHNDFKANMLTTILQELVDRKKAKDKIIILDTLKKFTDLMDKTKGSDFANVAREFTSNGGTLISLAHVNKHKGADGKSVHAGTSDLSDDSDCVYVIDVIENDADVKVVEFFNTKSRGDVDKITHFSYDQSKTDYTELLKSIQPVNNGQATALKTSSITKNFKSTHSKTIQLIRELIMNGTTSQKGIMDSLKSSHELSSSLAREVILEMTDDEWEKKTGSNNKYIYSLITPPP